MKIIQFFKDILVPKKCYFCKKEGHFCCPQCMKNKQPPYCYTCKKSSHFFEIHKGCRQDIFYDKVIIFSSYTKVKRLIKDAKYYFKKDILEDFGLYLSDIFSENEKISLREDYIIIPVPMYFLRKYSRGYNHSQILAKNISKNIGVSCNHKIVRRIKNTSQQSKLSKEERLSNLDKAFQINKKHMNKIKGKNIILVDDVISTGVTLNKISSLLRQSGAKRVIGLVIASNSSIVD